MTLTPTLRLLAPVELISVFAFMLLTLDAWAQNVTPGLRRSCFVVALLGLIAPAASLVFPSSSSVLYGRDMLVWDGLSYFFSWISILALFLVILLSEGYSEFDGKRLGSYYGLLLLAGAGLMLLASANDFLMIFIAIELVGIPSFIAVGFLRHKERSSEAAIKYFLIGAFSSAMLIYGISLIYGLTSATSLTQLHDHLLEMSTLGPLGYFAVFFVLVSIGFKMGYVPFHMWVPDVFEGAPKPIAAFLSIAPKLAGAAIALRIFGLAFTQPSLGYLNVIAAIAAITMTTGNIIGLQQTNIVRLLAYSSIAHMGYLLLGLVGGGALGFSGMYLYGWVYLFMNIGAFAIVIGLSRNLRSDDLSAYAGLARRSPWIAGLLTLFLLSLAGVPPTAGFIAKFYVFAAAFQSGWIWLVLVATVNSVISVGYYFKILYWMYFKPATDNTPIVLDLSERLTLGATSFITLFLGLCPQLFISVAQAFTVMPK